MRIVTYLLLALLLFGVFRTHRSVRRSVTAVERGMAIRVSAFAWLMGFIFLIALIFLPNKQRVIMMLPAFIFAVAFAKFWRDKRARMRRENAERVNLERMKRVN